jgi:hypothetical protein
MTVHDERSVAADEGFRALLRKHAPTLAEGRLRQLTNLDAAREAKRLEFALASHGSDTAPPAVKNGPSLNRGQLASESEPPLTLVEREGWLAVGRRPPAELPKSWGEFGRSCPELTLPDVL